MPRPKPGIHRNVPFTKYLAWDAVNHSILKRFERSAAHAKAEELAPTDSSAEQDFGQAFHSAVLEPDDFDKEYVVAPKVDKRTREGKATWKAFTEKHPNATHLEADKYDTICRMRQAVYLHPTASEIMSGPGANELAVVWDDPETKIRCKARLDRVTSWGGYTTVADLKSAEDASWRGFQRAIARYSYHTQCAHYLEGLDVLEPRARRFVFVAVEKVLPFAVACYELDSYSFEQARVQMQNYLKAYAAAEKAGYWPAYPDQCQQIGLPKWAIREDLFE